MANSETLHKLYIDKNVLINDLKKYIKKDDIIYIKGSRSMKMEDIIKGLES